jgi:ubiquinone/menaquinone biosynthesis C-methylase UbiE
MKPFDDVEAYIAFLDREEREAWQKPDAVIEALHLTGDETIIDLGAGSGYFTFRFAQAVPGGKVVAIDIEPEMIRHIHHRAMANGAENIEVILAEPDDPRIPDGADLVFLCDVLHHVPDKAPWLDRITSRIRTGSRLVIVEFKQGDLPEGPPEHLKIAKERILELATNAGLVLESDQTELLPYQSLLIFRQP